MADDVLSNFLVKIAFDQDERSRKKFDEGLKQVQTRAAEFGAKIGELPTIVSEATKRISASLTEMYYSAQKNGATARELDALRYAAKQSGEGADKAEASFNAFSQRIRDFATGAGKQYKSMFGVDIDPNHTMDAFLKVREKIEELRNRGGAENLSRANLYARTFGIDEDALVAGRMAVFKKAWIEEAKRNEGLAAEKAVALTRAYNALAAALETVARKADAALFDKFGAVLDHLTKWLDEDSERIVKFFTDLATQVGLVFTDLAKLSPAFVLLWEALKEVGVWLQKIIGNPDSSGLAGVRHLLEFISGVVMARFVASMVAGFVLAFAPLTALLAGLAALGVISVGAYTAGEAVRGWLGGSGGFGAGEGTEGGGHGATRRSRFGHGGGGARRGSGSEGGTGGGGGGSDEAPRAGGSRSWRNNNPGNIEYGPFAKAHGAIGSDGRFAVFPTEESGTNAQRYLLFESPTYKNLMLPQAIAKWAPGSENNVPAYVAAMGGDTSGKKMSDYSKDEQDKLLASMRKHEGWIVGKPPVPAVNKLVPDFHKRLDEIRSAKPLAPWQQSSNEIHDYRSVDNDVNIHVSASPVDRTAGILGRPRNADLIRNTASYAS